MRSVLAVLARIPRMHVLERDDRLVHAVVASRILRIPLDLEIIVDPDRGRVDLRAYRAFAVLERSRSRALATGLLQLIEDEIRWAG